MDFKVLCVGFGRMGISHTLGALGLINNDVQLVICEKSLISRSIAKILIGQKISFISDYKLQRLRESYFDLVIVSTPPFERSKELKLFSKIGKRVLIEKPVSKTFLPKNTFSGYSLQHSPLFAEAKCFLLNKSFDEVTVTVKTPESFIGGTGWRNGLLGGLVNEFAGHSLSLLGLLPDTSNLIYSNMNKINDNAIYISGTVGSETLNFKLQLIGGQSSIRKTQYVLTAYKSGIPSFIYDTYEFSFNGCRIHNICTVGARTGFYLRGFDYANELQCVLNEKEEPIGRSFVNSIENFIEALNEKNPG